MGFGLPPLLPRVIAWHAVAVSPFSPPSHILITQGVDAPSHRHLHAYTQWARKRSLHLFNVYAYGASYPDRLEQNAAIYQRVQAELAQLGRVPWILGGDFNQGPTEDLSGWSRPARVAAPLQPTHDFGRALEWFLHSPS